MDKKLFRKTTFEKIFEGWRILKLIWGDWDFWVEGTFVDFHSGLNSGKIFSRHKIQWVENLLCTAKMKGGFVRLFVSFSTIFEAFGHIYF